MEKGDQHSEHWAEIRFRQKPIELGAVVSSLKKCSFEMRSSIIILLEVLE
jgi:hypothetical protein